MTLKLTFIQSLSGGPHTPTHTHIPKTVKRVCVLIILYSTSLTQGWDTIKEVRKDVMKKFSCNPGIYCAGGYGRQGVGGNSCLEKRDLDENCISPKNEKASDVRRINALCEETKGGNEDYETG